MSLSDGERKMADKVKWIGRQGQCTISFDHNPHICSYTMTSSGPKDIIFCPGRNPKAKVYKCTQHELEFEPSEERDGVDDII